MIPAILRTHAGLIPVFAVLALLAGAVAWRFAPRRGLDRRLAVLLALCLAGELTLTLSPTGHNLTSSHICTYSTELWRAFGNRQGLLNLALYAPLAFFTALLLDRPLIALAGCWLLSAGTETAQALLPIGRTCDSQDFVGNATGALVGILLAIGWRWRRRRALALPNRRELLWSGLPLAVGAVVVFAVQSSAVSPRWVTGKVTSVVSSEKRALAVKDAALVYGPGAEVVSVQEEAATDSTPDLLVVNTRTAQLSIEWPSGQLNQGTDYATAAPSPSPSPGSGTGSSTGSGSAARADAQARAVADAFARQWYAPELAGTTVRVYQADPAKQRRTVEYRRYRGDGLLEPFRLDVQVDPTGRIEQFTSRNVPDPQLVPATVSRQVAVATVGAAHPGAVLKVQMVAALVGTQWRPCWSVTLANSSDPGSQGTSYQVDAVTDALVYPSPAP
ncbi:VanZ family protein [Kitasatospora sp. NBC_01302]|uniref:VanZ family protein n=1 Tax=Kitasatospora sp. NBC_01302 TaxID=2903575 RepID=UPI002E0F0FD1|nr:VanZ family protein [Kitasatospora sp. NBC_01302]